MNEVKAARGAMRNSPLMGNKFHRIFGQLSVALEATLLKGTEVGVHPAFQHLAKKPDLKHELPYETVKRLYYPALAEGNIEVDEIASITFVPWFSSGGQISRYRLVFRLEKNNAHRYPWVRFGRIGEPKAFGFSDSNKDQKGAYINLVYWEDGKVENFNPVFVKIQDDSRRLLNFVIADHRDETAVSLAIIRVKDVDLPPCLVNERP